LLSSDRSSARSGPGDACHRQDVTVGSVPGRIDDATVLVEPSSAETISRGCLTAQRAPGSASRIVLEMDETELRLNNEAFG
jgi:hypothetical protein